MVNETRVNIKHLLEDIRDSYRAPLEEVILTELIANALDSKATTIAFSLDRTAKRMRCVDDGCGMKRSQLREYHNIATTTKTKGTGIGFAGVGAKLSLLLAERVVTESKGGYGSQCATEWGLTGSYRAPWKFIPFSGGVAAARGTAISIYFSDNQSHLLDAEFVRQAIMRHFYPLLHERMFNEVLHSFYKKPITIFVNEQKLTVFTSDMFGEQNWFRVYLGRSRQPIGAGFLARTETSASWFTKLFRGDVEKFPLGAGVWVSTFGKMIRGGWEWLGMLPKNHEKLYGIVEIPMLAELLTTNKNDFLSDAASLKKYYKYRRAAQEAVMPILQAMGEDQTKQGMQSDTVLVRPVMKMVDSVLTSLLTDFPELESLVGGRHKTVKGKAVSAEAAHGVRNALNMGVAEQSIQTEQQATAARGDLKPEKKTVPIGERDATARRSVRAPHAGITIVLGEITDTTEPALGRLLDNVLTVNTAHPAWRKARAERLQQYHMLLVVALTLSQFLESQKTPQEFVNRFLQAWAGEAPLIKETGML